jgi:hypothetical protein
MERMDEMRRMEKMNLTSTINKTINRRWNVVCNENGQLGTGDNQDKMIPTTVKGLEDIKIISFDCGAFHNTALSGNSFMPFTTNPYFLFSVFPCHLFLLLFFQYLNS